MKNRLAWFRDSLGTVLTLVVTVMRLFPHLSAIRRAEIVAIYPYIGFGDTIADPDAASRLFPNKRCVFIFFSVPMQHNWKAALLWRSSKVRLVFLPYNLKIGLLKSFGKYDCPTWYRRMAPVLTMKFAKTLVGAHATVMSSDAMEESHKLYPFTDAEKDSLSRIIPNHRWAIAYTRLVREVPVPSLHLPETLRSQVHRKLQTVLPSSMEKRNVPRCCLYLRQKSVFAKRYGKVILPVRDTVRDGSPLEDYLDGVRLLNKGGYQVLLTGDATLSDAMYRDFHGMLVDAAHSHTNHQVFYLYAATESDIFIGEVGGGTWLPGINQIPRLLLNTYPYFYGFPRSWMYYKQVIDEKGTQVPCRKLFWEHTYDWSIPGMKILNNTREEITEAIDQYLKDVKTPWNQNPNDDAGIEFPLGSWIRHSGAKFSPAWLRRYGTSDMASSADTKHTIAQARA